MKAILFALFSGLFLHFAWGGVPDEQIFEVSSLNGAVLSDPVIAFSQENQVYLPLLDLAKILGIRVEQPDPLHFNLYQSEKDFSTLDFSKCLPAQKNLSRSQPPECEASLVVRETRYIHTDYLVRSLGWPLLVDLKNLRITINVGQKIKEASAGKKEDLRPYTLTREKFAHPAARIEATTSSRHENDLVNLYETQSLLDHDSDILLSRSDQNTTARWTLSKESVEPSSPYAVRNYEIGSTQTIDSKYLFSPTQITGFSFSNIKAGENVFDTQNIYDKGPPRWKVELYVNDIFLGETFIDLNGNFSFLNVPIFYGQNRIRYKLTSPLGKVLETERIYDVSTEFAGSGKLKYQLAFGQQVNNANYVGGAAVNQGFSSNVSGQAGYAQFALLDSREIKKYGLLGVSFLQPNYSFTTTRMASLKDDEKVWIFSPQFNAGRLFVTGEYAAFENLKSLLINPREGDDLQSLRKVSALTSFDLRYPLTTQVSFLESTFGSISSTQQVQLRAYSMLESASLLVESNKFWPSNANPDLYVEYGKYSRSLRGKYGVQMQDDRYAKTKIELEYLVKTDNFLTLTADLPARPKEAAYALGVNTLWGEFQTEVDAIYALDQFVLSLTLSTNIKMTEKGYRLSHDENYRQANLEIFAFVDENSNGHFDIGEKPYPRLRVLETRRQKEYETDTQGTILIPALNPYERVNLQIVKESIANIFLTAADFQSDFILTPAQQLRVEVPVTPSFDVRGEIEVQYFKKLIPLELVDDQNKVIASTLSAATGKFKFTDLAGGRYFVRVHPAFLQENKLISEPEMLAVELTGKAGVRSAGRLRVVRTP